MFEVGFWVVVLILALTRTGSHGRPLVMPPAPPAGTEPTTLDQDFQVYRDAVSDQDSRLDALDSSLGAVAALIFAILTYLPEHHAGTGTIVPIWEHIGDGLMIVGIIASLYAAIAFRGSDGPDLAIMLPGLRSSREQALFDGISDLAKDYGRNKRLKRAKTAVFRVSLVLGTLGSLVISNSPVVH